MSTTPPRYSAPDSSGQRVRLVTAIGLLMGTAIAVGAVVHLVTEGEPGLAPAPLVEGGPPRADESRASADPSDPVHALIGEIERAERAVSSARAALRSARTLGSIDREQLEWLERRLDALGDPAPTPATALPMLPEPEPREL